MGGEAAGGEAAGGEAVVTGLGRVFEAVWRGLEGMGGRGLGGS